MFAEGLFWVNFRQHFEHSHTTYNNRPIVEHDYLCGIIKTEWNFQGFIAYLSWQLDAQLFPQAWKKFMYVVLKAAMLIETHMDPH